MPDKKNGGDRYADDENTTLAKMIIRELAETALADGEVNADEAMILGVLRKHSEELQAVVDEAPEDSIIEEHEMADISAAREKIVDAIMKVAKDDGVVSADEQQLIDTLNEIVERHLQSL